MDEFTAALIFASTRRLTLAAVRARSNKVQEANRLSSINGNLGFPGVKLGTAFAAEGSVFQRLSSASPTAVMEAVWRPVGYWVMVLGTCS